MVTTGFRPSEHGWAFENAFRYAPSVLGLNVPIAPDFGLCAGLCWTALDRYRAERLPTALDAPAPGDPLYEELMQRQANVLSTGVWREVQAWHDRPDAGRWWQRGDAGTLTLGAYRRVRRSLDRGSPVLLCLIRSAGPFANPTESHFVLAWAYEHDRKEKRGRLLVYDPSHPGRDDVAVELGLSREEGRVSMSQSTGESVRGFFVVPYDRPEPLRFRGERYEDRQPMGYNHPLAGKPAALAAAGHLDVFVRDANADVIHFTRNGKTGWKAANLTAPDDTAGIGFRLATDPVVATGPGKRCEIFGRTSQGDVVCYGRGLRGWRAENLTERKKIGVDYRIKGDPAVAVGPGRHRWVFGRNGDGHLIQYRRGRGGWTASNLTRERDFKVRYRLDTDPVVAVGPGEVVHVFGLDERGALLHYYWTPKGDWAAENLTERQRPADIYRLAGRPVVVNGPGTSQSVFARDAEGSIVRYAWSRSTSWLAERVTEHATPVDGVTGVAEEAGSSAGDRYGLAGDPVVTLGPDGTIHLLGRNAAGGLVHYARPRSGNWTVEDLTAERPAIDHGLRLGGDPVTAFGPGPSQHVIARNTRDLILYQWQPTPSWTAENLTMERAHLGADYQIAGEPVMVTGPAAEPHVFATDAKGRLIHVYAVT